ncbi:unnamed protein product [Linum tenue]|uniref:Uncharacterized protein n=4 Tax=Linum tenue TaxID=586396 RepID=A0AAV0Q320_9ROSI|nr:unnamed protein product [Linum tenue]
MLTDENMDAKSYLCYDPLALRETEMSLYHVIGEQYPSHPSTSSSNSPLNLINGDLDLSVSDYAGFAGSTEFLDPQWNALATTTFGDSRKTSVLTLPYDWQQQPAAAPSFDDMMKNMFSNEESVLQFNKGLEEAQKFLPVPNTLLVDLETNSQNVNSISRKNNHKREEDSELEEGRSTKQTAIHHEEEGELTEMFDKVLLLPEGQPICCGMEYQKQPEVPEKKSSPKHNGGRKARGGGKKQGKNKKDDEETVDLRGLLVLCAQAVSSSDFRTANELLKQIRQNSSPTGDGSQRLAHFFANGLEARLAGSSPQIPNFFSSISSNRISAADILKAYKTHLQACPFKKLSILFANKTIYHAAEHAATLHIVDFGIMFGFQWPILIQFLAMRPGGPPKLRITGIELPQRGFRPSERNEETGRRLAKYCERFGVPFEYHPIASQNWESIEMEDLKIEAGEVVAVNSLCRLKNLLEESIDSNSPRNAVLKLIKRMKPDIFVQTVINGAYNAPFFVTRFREALFHFSSLFDIFECTLGREDPERMMFEREIYGRELMNAVAAEGAERVERPETYKQWQIRNVRAGFKAVPLSKELLEKVRGKMKSMYHKDFVLDQDGNWMLQGWKGRIIYASSCWVPA